MAYTGLTPDSFKKALKDGKYESATGARRAIGKAQGLNDKQRDTARAQIDAFFGTSAPVKPVAKKAAAKKAAPAAKKAPVTKSAPAAKAPVAKKSAAKKASAPKREKAVREAQIASVHDLIPQNTDQLQDLLLGERLIAAGSSTLEMLKSAKELLSNIDTVAATAASAHNLVAKGIEILRGVVGAGDVQPKAEKVTDDEPEAEEDANEEEDAPAPNGAGRAAFAASLPG